VLLFIFHTDGAIQSCNATAYVMSAALSPGALIALLVCMLILIGELTNGWRDGGMDRLWMDGWMDGWVK
jgi:hypothetical protein